MGTRIEADEVSTEVDDVRTETPRRYRGVGRRSNKQDRPAASGLLRGLQIFVTVGLLGVLLIAIGLGIDTVLHARNPDLAGEEGLFTLENPGHILLALGIGATAAGLGGAASILIRDAGYVSRPLRIGRVSLLVGMIGLVAAFAYVAAGPGFGHGHGDIAPSLEMSDGTRLSSSIAADVDRSRLPPEEAAALAALAWSRAGTLEEGTEHDHDDTGESAADLSPAEREALDAQLAAAVQTVPRYMTVAQAEADGYVQASESVNGVGAHWVKWSLVDQPFDPATPSMLLFEEVKWGEGPSLVGFSYWVASEDVPEGFAGETDVWHQHYGLCIENGWLALEDIPDRASCAGDWIHGGDLWMLHAWIVPGLDDNRLGVFAPVHPRLCERSCG